MKFADLKLTQVSPPSTTFKDKQSLNIPVSQMFFIFLNGLLLICLYCSDNGLETAGKHASENRDRDKEIKTHSSCD